MAQPVGGDPAEVYERYLVPALFLPWAEELLRRAAPQPGERVLDVACGTGAVTRQVPPLVGATGTVVGLDLSPAMLDVARALPAPPGPTIAWREGSAVALPFPDAAFDLVLCQQGLQFFPDRPRALREMRRVLAPGGRVVLSVSRGLERQPVYAALNAAIERRLGVPAMAAPFSLGDATELGALLRAAGFRNATVEPVVRTVRFPSPQRFVRLSVLGAAAVPALGEMDAAARETLVEAVRGDTADALRPYEDGDALAFPLAVNVAEARA
jgi:ubiquinone/menaquinone biosynthesis C-methylase UbiE